MSDHIVLSNPTELLNRTKLFHDDLFYFQYQDFKVRFELKDISNIGLMYDISFEYPTSQIRTNHTFCIGSEGYSNLLLKAMLAKRLSFDISQNIKNARLSRADIIQDHGLRKELLFHAQCIVFLFQIMDKIVHTHKRQYIEYCHKMIQLDEVEKFEDSFTNFFLLKACRLLKKSGFGYFEKTINVSEESSSMNQLWKF